MRGPQHAVEALDHPGQPLLAPQQGCRPLVAAVARRFLHASLDLLDHALAGSRLLEVGQSEIELAPADVRVEVPDGGTQRPIWP